MLPGEHKSAMFTYFAIPLYNYLLKKLGSADTAVMLEIMAPDDRTEIFENFATIGILLVGIVLWDTLTASMIPFILRRFSIDPAT